MPDRPVVAVAACHVDDDGVTYARTRLRYVEALRAHAGAIGVLVPSLGSSDDALAVVDRCDGVLLPGSESDVAADRYGGTARPGAAYDHRRDDTATWLVHAAVARHRPLLGICRGLQEMNVAYGGDLTPDLAAAPGLRHDEDLSLPRDEQYLPAHTVTLTPGGLLHGIAGASVVGVSSLHHQGVRRLAPGLAAEAVASDGLVEAASVTGAAFALGVQWHPEWLADSDPFSQALFSAFGAACRTAAVERCAP